MTMGGVKLELRCPKKVYSIALDPNPDWSFENLVSELNALEIKINSGSKVPLPFSKEKSRNISNWKGNARNSTSPFVMRVFDDDMDNIEDEEVHHHKSVVAKRFNFDELYLSDSDDSGDESSLDAETHLMEKVDLVESSLLELSREHQFKVKEEIRNQISALETELKSETDKSISAVVRVEKYRKERSEMDRKLDTQYQRKIAEALDNHLTVVQRDLEVRSQIEERKIRSDAAYEDAKRKEAEEKLRQERAKAEAEEKRVEEAKRAEEGKRAALEAQRRAADEAAAKKASETSKKPDTDANVGSFNAQSGGPQVNKPAAGANKIRAAESALNLEQGRLQKLKQLDEEVQALRSSSNENYGKYERQISKLIQQITGTTENVRQKEYELLKIFCDACCPQSISTSALAKKVVSNCKCPGNPAFAQAFVIVRITSKVRHAMDLILAELHKACIYTVPKHYSRSAFGSNEAYYKALGFQEDDEGKIESVDSYLTRLESYMKLYGALVQTEIDNVHGLKEGWAWLARFVNALPANRYTAVALAAFLRMAGYSLFRKYRNQFVKLLNMVSDNFLNALKQQGDSDLSPVIVEIESYIKDREFLREPEGRQLKSNLQSDRSVP